MDALGKLKKRLRPGSVYRRADLAKWSAAVDRHIKELVGEGALRKAASGLYYVPRQTAFGPAPAEDHKLVAGFLKDDRFLMTSPNVYNGLGVGTTQLHNKTVVYNRKRHGKFTLAGRPFEFRVKPDFPTKVSQEFLLIDLVNNLATLGEDQNQVLSRVSQKASNLDAKRLARAAKDYGSVRTRKFFEKALAEPLAQHAR
ncbi:hypothetical protein PMI01_03847 [Caulobacter sp. AP07]|uniref:hypothetical protein n=1 Tax=Caulobacter sp. AP07 TaxID=1144304 RepID=UPI000272117C|nr:hypothetical protein [Caulobacter sp. AP07]EJL27366.1 hypothetical protein PMI01_03847 [Caulobacter sp. AP07]